MAQILALVDDIFFQAKILETARQLGVDLRICATPEALLAEAAKASPRLVVVDLHARSRPLEAISELKSIVPEIRIVAFLSHVAVELADKARAAGCREVLPRSKFTRELATLLAEVKSESA